jgi:serine/threonine protein kinase/tetratricopeptide (TPR) repeat protein
MNEESLFVAALDKVTADERRAFLDEACGADTALRQRVAQLLAADDAAGGILDRGPDGVARTTANLEPRLAAGRLFAGRFRLGRKIGEGGMGEVWDADQIEPVERRVALKLVRAGLDSACLLARFDQERQALALMDHPNIAKVFDAGVADGRPYFVMELIQGRPITEYCDAARLTLRERLELFLPVCHAVQHAHQKGIIHRDLKPTNILVARYDGRPVPKVIDFGVAKATGPRLSTPSVHTEVGSLIGTLEYMSPEQADLNNVDIDTRSDIYALGAILYELLTGGVPFSPQEQQADPFSEMLRRIKEVDPPLPSAKLSGSETLPSVAAVRQTEPQKLTALLRGELDWIVMKCLEKDRTRRYETADGLALDVERYLRDEPVLAGPPSRSYRLRKFARRHARELTAALAFVLLLVTAVLTLAVGLIAVNRERQEKVAALEAEGERRQEARRALDAMSSLVIEDWLAQQKELSPAHRQFLEEALRMYEKFAADTGQGEDARAGMAHAYLRVGVIRDRLGQRTDAEAAYRRGRELFAGLVADFPADSGYRHGLASTHNNLGLWLCAAGQLAAAEAAYTQALTIQKQLIADFPAHPDFRRERAATLHNLGILLKDAGRPKEAEAAYDQAVAIDRQLVADFPTVPDYRHKLALCQLNLGVLLDSLRQSHEAEEALGEAVDIGRQLVAEFPTVTVYREMLGRSLNNLGNVVRDAGRHSEAEAIFRQSLAIRKQLVADFPVVTEYRQGLAIALNNLGILLKDTDRAPEAEELYGQSLAIHKQLAADFPADPDHQNEAAGAMVNLARLLLNRKELPGARRLLEEALPYHQAALKASSRHPAYRRFYRNNRWRMAETLLELKDHAGAAQTAGQFLQAAVEPPRDAYTAGGLLAGCVRLAAQDEQLPESQRQELATTYGDRAVAALRLAFERRAKEVTQMKADPVLDPLRHREDFRKLLAEVEARIPP